MYFKTDKGNLWYTDTIKGKNAIVLIHGYLESAEIWNGFANKLSQSFRIIAVDLPGHGLSEFAGDVYNMDMMADAVSSLIDSLKLRKVIMAGHSLGGYVTLAFLDRHSEYLSGYCLFHSHPFPDTPVTADKRTKDIELIRQGREDSIFPEAVKKMYATVNLTKFSNAVKRSIDISAQADGQGVIGILRGMIARPSRVNLMEEGRIPCLWILGSMDNFIPHDTISDGIKLPNNALIRTLEHSGHMGFIEEEDLSVEMISEFTLKVTRS